MPKCKWPLSECDRPTQADDIYCMVHNLEAEDMARDEDDETYGYERD